MAHEDEIAALLEADATLLAILTGGVYTAGTVGLDGITRESAPDAFDASGWLLPCALVKQRGNVPTSDVRDYDAQVTSATQVVEVWLYSDQGDGYTAIDQAKDRIYTLLQGEMLSDSFEVTLTNVIDRQRDTGALNGSSMARMDFAVYSLIGV